MKTLTLKGGTLVAFAIVTGCASREVPPRFPQTAAASYEAPSAPQTKVTHALEAEVSAPEQSPATEHTGHHGHRH